MARQDQQRVSDLDESSPTLGALFRALIKRVKLEVYVNLPATVTLYDTTTERATVTIGWLEVVRNLDVPTPNAELPQPPKVLTGIPVAWPDNGAGDGYRFPIVPGVTTGSVRVYDRSLASWMMSPPGVPVDPFFAFTHALADSVFWPDLRPKVVPVTPVANPAAHVVRASTLLQLGGDPAVLGVARLTDTTTPDVTMTAWLAASQIVLSGAAVFLGLTPPVAPTDFGIIDSASTKVVSE